MQFWPLLCNDGVHLNSFLKESLFLPNKPDLFVKGRDNNTLFGTKALKSCCLALRKASDSFPSTVGFVRLPEGGAPCANLRRFAQVCLTLFSLELQGTLFSIMPM